MPKKAGIVMFVTGAVLILSALLLFLYNQQEDRTAGQEAESLLTQVREAIATQETLPAETPAGDPQDQPENGAVETEPQPTDYIDPTMTVVTINGEAYIGYLSIPSQELTLPVMSEWTYDRLKYAPCRHFGSTKTDDLVIAAHNYNSHFGRLKDLQSGDSVLFTDMDGLETAYALEKIEMVAPTDVEAVQNSGYDLVLYTCTPGGQTRVCAFLNRVTEQEAP